MQDVVVWYLEVVLCVQVQCVCLGVVVYVVGGVCQVLVVVGGYFELLL